MTANNSAENTIVFDSALAGETIRLNNPLTISNSLTIDASGLSEPVTLDAQGGSRVINVTNVSADLSLNHLVITGGQTNNVGGGIRFQSNGILTLNQTKVVDNHTLGLDGYGGGISTHGGEIVLVDSEVSGNSTSGEGADGGGIRTLDGNVTLVGSTISGNTTSGFDADGGGIHTTYGFVTSSKSTFSGNHVMGFSSGGGAIVNEHGRVSLSHTTLVFNHSDHGVAGGVNMDVGNFSENEQLLIYNSILAGNTDAGTAADFLAPSGTNTVLDVEHSFISDLTGSTLAASAIADADGNLVGTADSPLDAALSPLELDGGKTPVHRLLSHSAAIDAGDPSIAAGSGDFDQRGFERVSNGRADMGSYEVVQFEVNDAGDFDDGLIENGVTTLREAIHVANQDSTHAMIRFDPSMSGSTITLSGSELDITSSLTIDASVAGAGITIDADSASRVISFDTESGDLTLRGLTITGGLSADSGGGVYFYALGKLHLVDTQVTGNLSLGDGGGVYARPASGLDPGELVLENSVISDNTSQGNGGGLFQQRSPALIVDSTISGNESRQDGGGFYTQYGNVDVTRSTISGNEADNNGGGVYNIGSVLTFRSSTISGNTAGEVGGGVYDRFLHYLYYSTVTDNEAGLAAGGLHKSGSSGTVYGSIISGNRVGGRHDNITGYVSGDYNLLGAGATTGGANDLITDDPMLGSLADNGGLTATHALLPGSPALNAGNPALVVGESVVRFGNVFPYDQRGFDRISDGRIDLGAYEQQVATNADCDFDSNGICDLSDIDALVAEVAAGTDSPTFDMTADGFVDLADRDAWLTEAGTINVGGPYLVADANLDGAVDVSDLNLWNSNKFTLTAAWSLGDWNADGSVDVSDLNLWNNNKFQTSDRLPHALILSPSKRIAEDGNVRSEKWSHTKLIDRVFAAIPSPDEH